MSAPETVRVVATDPDNQGPFVVINAADFDPAQHQPYEPEETPPAAPETTRGPGRPRKAQGA